ncbi:Ger(x)C family spore germination protein [Halobacillus sp. A1]|uniref:Ger(x)C family spore germination protein n=1 Tax=Halobacillus sp. A1 TaxID=2880262 RepID=UPI0020A6797B|nr:Ger(x)C family spore germination protein [Halobacillus sp. A1]MCP3032405.1 Ger(x)C family spore germination protein [Halobacillus sp. A1]
MIRFIICNLCTLLILTGCWDQRQFKNVKLTLTIGYDEGEEGEIYETVSIPTVKGSEGIVEETVQVLSSDARTPLDARDKIDQMISESFNPSKVKVVLIGDELAKSDIYPLLDNFYRNPNSNLNAQLTIVEGTAKEAINFNSTGDTKISEYISGILKGASSATHAHADNMQMLWGELIEEGEDFTLPLLKVDEESDVIKFNGLGLMREDYYTGIKISPEQSTLFLLMEGNKGNVARMTRKVLDDQPTPILEYITFQVLDFDRKMKIRPEGKEVNVDMALNLDIHVTEYPHDHLVDEKIIEDLNNDLSNILTEEASEIFSITQEANSDVFSIGRMLKAYHPDVWKELDWAEGYKDVTFNPKVEVTIQNHGIIN